MPVPTSRIAPDFQSFNETCLQSVNCDCCFASGFVERASIDIAQPRYVGRNYWTAETRVLFLSINPGAGAGSIIDMKMRSDIHDFKAGRLALDEVFSRQRNYMVEWGRNGAFLRYFDKIGCDLKSIAMLNVAWCATKDDCYPTRMLETCFSKHTQKAIEALRPTRLVACGKNAQMFARVADLNCIAIPHYAARQRIDFEAIRRAMKQSSAERSDG